MRNNYAVYKSIIILPCLLASDIYSPADYYPCYNVFMLFRMFSKHQADAGCYRTAERVRA